MGLTITTRFFSYLLRYVCAQHVSATGGPYQISP